VHIHLVSRQPLNTGSALGKADLFERVFQKQTVLHTAVVPQRSRPVLDLDFGLAYAEEN
jgi:hypothetical protein